MNKHVNIVSQPLREKMLSISEFIYRFPQSKYPFNYGLMGGEAGHALLLIECYRFFDKKEYLSKAIDIISTCFENFNGNPRFSFSDGLAGMGWLLCKYKDVDGLDFNFDEILLEIDQEVYDWGISEMEKGNIDYLHGAMGAGLYFLNRDCDLGNKFVLQIIDYLGNKAVVEGDNIKWKVYLLGEVVEDRFNLGLSHGIPSIMSFLSKCYSKGYEMEKCNKLIRGAYRYLCSCESSSDSYTWPHNFPEDESVSRLGWCYGDLGVCVSLLSIGSQISDAEIVAKAIRVIENSTKRIDLKENLVWDYCVCHGSVGNMLLFYLGNKILPYQDADTTIKYWADVTLSFSKYDDGYCGYKAFLAKLSTTMPYSGILEGVSGIGLVFLACLSDDDPKWKEMLLL